MTLIYKLVIQFLSMWLILCLAFPSILNACDKYEIQIEGLKKTNETWFRDYLDLEHLSDHQDVEAQRIRQKIMSTDIFIDASVQLNFQNDEFPCTGTIKVHEKWTAIPVIRGAYGGGTPLIVLGAYETNAFGRLLAIGGELRRYGAMAPGGIVYLKSPKAWKGLGLWGGEILLDRRRRDFFDDRAVVFAHADTEAWTGKFQMLRPVGYLGVSKMQVGLQLQLTEEKPTVFFEEGINADRSGNFAPDGLESINRPGPGGSIGPLVILDGLSVEGLSLEGTKIRSTGGFSKATQQHGYYSELEMFSYVRLDHDFNLAFHMFAANTNQNSVGSIYYLGGFDSIRGLPDGIHYGNRAAYLNFETRWIAKKYEYAHIQPVLFCDSGSVWLNQSRPSEGQETSIGSGVRIAVPQIYRFIVRLDYGVSIGKTKSRGFSVGLNQFFQPYKLTF
jgi:Haemolysin secretion/activation protein ShlB/FhaC/HecB